MTDWSIRVTLLLCLITSSANSLSILSNGGEASGQQRYGITNNMLPKLPSGHILKIFTTQGGVLGGTVWPAASILCSYLAENQHKLNLQNNAKCVELGSGTGAVGLFAAGLGAANVILTDCRPPPDSAMYTTDGTCTLPSDGSDAVLDILRQNLEANQHVFSAAPPQVMELDWTNSQDSHRVVAEISSDGFDIVLASDVTHFSSMHQPLASTIAQLLRRRDDNNGGGGAGVCLLSHQQRMVNLQGQDMQLTEFEQTARSEGLEIEYLPLAQVDQSNTALHDAKKSILLLRHKDSAAVSGDQGRLIL